MRYVRVSLPNFCVRTDWDKIEQYLTESKSPGRVNYFLSDVSSFCEARIADGSEER